MTDDVLDDYLGSIVESSPGSSTFIGSGGLLPITGACLTGNIVDGGIGSGGRCLIGSGGRFRHLGISVGRIGCTSGYDLVCDIFAIGELEEVGAPISLSVLGDGDWKGLTDRWVFIEDSLVYGIDVTVVHHVTRTVGAAEADLAAWD